MIDLLIAIKAGLSITCLLLLGWYLFEKCCSICSARKARSRRRVRFQTVWRSSTVYGDELDNILTRKDN